MAFEKWQGKPQIQPDEREQSGSRRDPEERPIRGGSRQEQARERALDKTLADSFPSSDPPSTIPDPVDEEAA